jgi:hypothetical protein
MPSFISRGGKKPPSGMKMLRKFLVRLKPVTAATGLVWPKIAGPSHQSIFGLQKQSSHESASFRLERRKGRDAGMLDQFTKYILGEIAVIAKAPATFFVASLAVAGVVFTVLDWRYSSIVAQKDAKMSSMEERIKLRDDQLANKLNSTPPEEARALIGKLEARLHELEPRHLDSGKRTILIEKIKPPQNSNYQIAIAHDGACVDCNRFAFDFVWAFKSVPGWNVEGGTFLGLGNPPRSGTAIRVKTIENLSDAERLVVEAFKSANIPFDLQIDANTMANVTLFITAPNPHEAP